MINGEARAFSGLDEDAAIRSILEGTATETGQAFFAALVRNLARALQTHGAWVTEYLQDCRRLRALAFWLGNDWIDGWEMGIDGTPCQQVIENAELVHFPDNLVTLFPGDPDIQSIRAMSYMGVPLLGVDGTILGHLAVLDKRPMPSEPRGLALFRIFAARATAELQRLRAEAAVREREEKLGRLIDGAMDAIVELDQDLRVTMMNAAAEKVFACPAARIVGCDFAPFISSASRDKLEDLIANLGGQPPGKRSLWIAGGLEAKRRNGERFAAEATLSQTDTGRSTFHTLILRDVNERLDAERKIRSLTHETEYLREELRALHNAGQIIGRSPAMLEALGDVAQVAPTDTTVLILGESGTGKELFARAIHEASPRSRKHMIKVNCAAVPAALMESEFFGHERGAFTGATARREGRFALAHRGTIFLDEIGELALDLQAKLLRVLQEGEFEPVGGSRTQKVDVRVIAATNRDLHAAVREGRFREDLFYRLHVFPLEVPPLRERGDDIALLAEAFVQKFSQKMGKSIRPLTEACLARLQRYDWPGNVRELENVIERGVITARDGYLNLDRALPAEAERRGAEPCAPVGPDPAAVLTAEALQQIERDNILRALTLAGGRVSGRQGAAERLGMNPSTLNSRIKALGIERPRK